MINEAESPYDDEAKTYLEEIDPEDLRRFIDQ
jgi:hypothetical protein